MNSIRTLLEAIGQNPWASIGLGTWLLFALALVTSTLQECVAIVVTRARPSTFPTATQAPLLNAEAKP